ncbi:MAG: GlxA family transcriptional regulator, partial [Burkholderiaceae bacterium]
MKRQIRVMKGQPRPPRITVAILLPQRVWLGSIHLARDLLQVAGTLAARSHDVAASALFEVRFLGLDTRPVSGFGGIPVHAETTIADRKRYDVVIVPPQFAATAESNDEDGKFSSWLVRQHRNGAFVLGLGSA